MSDEQSTLEDGSFDVNKILASDGKDDDEVITIGGRIFM